MIVTVAKTGTGTVLDPIRPDTDSQWWELISENATTMTIRILE